MARPPETQKFEVPCQEDLMSTIKLASDMTRLNMAQFAKERFILEDMIVVNYRGMRHGNLVYEIRKNDNYKKGRA